MASSPIKEALAASTPITITLDALASGNARCGVVVDNSANLYEDAHVSVNVPLAAGTPSGDKLINIYLFGSEDGTRYTDNAPGSDAAVTLRSPSNLIRACRLATPDAGAVTYSSGPIGVAQFFGNRLPRRWGIVVENRTGLAFGSGCSASYTGLYDTVG